MVVISGSKVSRFITGVIFAITASLARTKYGPGVTYFRGNVMKRTTSPRDVELPLLLPGMK